MFWSGSVNTKSPFKFNSCLNFFSHLLVPCSLDCSGGNQSSPRGYCVSVPSLSDGDAYSCVCANTTGYRGSRCEIPIVYRSLPFTTTTINARFFQDTIDLNTFYEVSASSTSKTFVSKSNLDTLFGCRITPQYDSANNVLDFESNNCPQCLKYYFGVGASAFGDEAVPHSLS